MDTKGGRAAITINGQTFSGRGAGKVMPSRVSLKNDANTDGTGYTTVAAKLAGIDVTFDRGIGLVWDETMLLQQVDVTWKEVDTGVTHYFTAGRWDGDPTIDTATGEVSGLKVMSDKYSRS